MPNLSLDGHRIVVDCANGAASAIAPQLFAELNAQGGGEVILTHSSPNGRNINERCGALHPEMVAAEVVTHRASMGITFDGTTPTAPSSPTSAAMSSTEMLCCCSLHGI